MNPQILAAIIAVAGAVSALCALVPADTKAKHPAVWKFLESVAVNVRKAANADGPKGDGRITLVTYALALGGAFLAQTTGSLPATVPAPPAAVTFVAVLPADPTAAALAVAVSPAGDVTP